MKLSNLRAYCILIFSIFCFLACAGHEVSVKEEKQTKGGFFHEPAEFEFRGYLRLVEKFGPPNYGESPKIDKKVKVWILKLETPISIQGDPKSSSHQESLTAIRELQLVCLKPQSPECMQLANKKDKKVLTKGSLSQAISGHHFTRAILNLKSIQLLD